MEITKMNYYFTGLLIILMSLLAFCVKPGYSAETQSNVSGSNTSIEGGYTGGANIWTWYQWRKTFYRQKL